MSLGKLSWKTIPILSGIRIAKTRIFCYSENNLTKQNKLNMGSLDLALSSSMVETVTGLWPSPFRLRGVTVIWLEFIVCATLIVAAAVVLSRYSDVLAEKTGLGRAWIGAILLAGVTSLPELASGVSAVVWLKAPNLAAGSILGSCLFNLVLLALMDLAYQPGSILAQAQEGHILSAGLGVLLLGAVAAGALLGPNLNGWGIFGVSAVSLAIVGLYFVGARLIARFEQRRLAEVLEREAQVLHYERISARRAYAVLFLAAWPW
jgi:cation:H+ antiporter